MRGYHIEMAFDQQSVAFLFLVYGDTLVMVPAELALEEYTSTDRWSGAVPLVGSRWQSGS